MVLRAVVTCCAVLSVLLGPVRAQSLTAKRNILGGTGRELFGIEDTGKLAKIPPKPAPA